MRATRVMIAAAIAVSALAARTAHAQEAVDAGTEPEPGATAPAPAPAPAPSPETPANGTADSATAKDEGGGLVDKTMSRSWWEGSNRFFFSTVMDAGYLYFRPRASVGYGLPFTRWVGIDANPVVSGSGMGVYGGLRFALEHIDLRVGSRYFYAFRHAFLPPLRSLGRLDLDNVERGRATLVTHEAEINGSLPVGPGDIIALLSVSYATGVPSDSFVFEETLKVVINPPLVWRARGGYVLKFGKYNQHSVGLVADVINVPKRDPGTTLRVGPVTRIVLSRHFEVRGSFVVPFISPDRLGLVGGDFAELGVRYRWATN